MAIFEITDLTFTYPEGKKPALQEVNLSVQSGEFLVICGKSGCGKSTLLKHLKTVLTPFGKRQGKIAFGGKSLEEADAREQASKIGYVLQNPENQIVTDKVWHELAYGLESLGYDNQTIRLRVAEMASFFGIQEWFYKSVFELSGGQKQLLNLASVMAMQPEVLILDEPTSQLDPIAAADFLGTIRKINSEIGTTIILSEHRLEEALPMADRAVVMDDGKILIDDIPEKIGYRLKELNHPMLLAMPAPMRIYLELCQDEKGKCPVTVREGKWFLNNHIKNGKQNEIKKTVCSEKKSKIKIQDAWFRYEKNGTDVLKGFSLDVKTSELYCMVGGNGTGKTTALNVVAGISKLYRGKITIDGIDSTKCKDLYNGMLGVLPQDPQCLFVKKTVKEDLMEMLSLKKAAIEEKEQWVLEVAKLTEITGFLEMHPYDISGGEQQRAALAKVLLTNPQILLLDEPTKGMDGFFKRKFAEILQKLKETGVTILMVSHDIEFCAEYADRCALFFDGGIVTQGEPRMFFSGNSFYTTASNRMCRQIAKEAVTVEDVISLCR
ncbi:MAG: ATP-binding cassette domain-containing protein [Christensenellaceae bacterium]